MTANDQKVDFKKTVSTYSARAGRFDVVNVPSMQYLMVDGHGDPNTSGAYADALAAIYPVAYTIKFASKESGRDYVVPPLEALWWADDMTSFTSGRDKSAWDWTVLIMVPEWVSSAMFETSVAKVRASDPPAALDAVRLDRLNEGLSVQTLHMGPYEAEAATLAHLHDNVIPSNGMRMTGKHHEIYLSDARRVAPERLRTILRQPVERIG